MRMHVHSKAVVLQQSLLGQFVVGQGVMSDLGLMNLLVSRICLLHVCLCLVLCPPVLFRKVRVAAFLAVEEVCQSIISGLSLCLSAAFPSTCTSNGLSSGCGGACYEFKMNQLFSSPSWKASGK